MTKVQFVEGLKIRTKKFAIEIIQLYEYMTKNEVVRIIYNQLIRSVTSTAANYRAACLARSKKEFFSKMSIVVEEADETYFWIDLLKETGYFKKHEADRLMKESLEIVKIMSKARRNIYKLN